MQDREFIAKVRERGGYSDTDEARKVTFVVLQLLGQRLDAEATDLAAQLPRGIGDVLLARGIGEVASGPYSRWSADPSEFLATAAKQLSTTPQTARWDAGAVLSAVTQAVTAGALNRALSRLQPGYSAFFGTTPGARPLAVLPIRVLRRAQAGSQS